MSWVNVGDGVSINDREYGHHLPHLIKISFIPFAFCTIFLILSIEQFTFSCNFTIITSFPSQYSKYNNNYYMCMLIKYFTAV